MATVTLEHLSKRFEKTDVIRDFNLTIADHEFLVLVGPSGCGKSTVLRMIAGLESPTGGTIRIGDQVMNAVAPKDRDIAMVFQSYALYPHMTVYDNMAFGLKMRKTPRDQIRTQVEAAARILDLEPLLTRKPKQLSGGQRQRVALGRAIVRNPKVFLMDEPLSNLDAKLRVQMRTEILKLHRRLKATTIYVTHDQVEAMTMGDRIVLLNQGVIQQVGAPAALYTQPANVFVGGFIGSMHFLSVQAQGETLLLPSGTRWPLPATIRTRLTPAGEVSTALQLGIRPEHFAVSDGPDRVALSITPDIVEHLGPECLVHFQWERQSLVATLPADAAVNEGQPMALFLDLGKTLYFEAATGQNLLKSPDSE